MGHRDEAPIEPHKGVPTPGWGHNINAGVQLSRQVFDDVRMQIERQHAGTRARRWWCVLDWLRPPAAKYEMYLLAPNECDAVLL
jgi:hypothetical protein